MLLSAALKGSEFGFVVAVELFERYKLSGGDVGVDADVDAKVLSGIYPLGIVVAMTVGMESTVRFPGPCLHRIVAHGDDEGVVEEWEIGFVERHALHEVNTRQQAAHVCRYHVMVSGNEMDEASGCFEPMKSLDCFGVIGENEVAKHEDVICSKHCILPPY